MASHSSVESRLKSWTRCKRCCACGLPAPAAGAVSVLVTMVASYPLTRDGKGFPRPSVFLPHPGKAAIIAPRGRRLQEEPRPGLPFRAGKEVYSRAGAPPSTNPPRAGGGPARVGRAVGDKAPKARAPRPRRYPQLRVVYIL